MKKKYVVRIKHVVILVECKIVPGGTTPSLLDLHDPPQLRAGFTNNQVQFLRVFFNKVNKKLIISACDVWAIL